MSVRRRRWRDPSTGAVKEAWMVDVKAIGKDGVRRRIRRVTSVRNGRAAERLEHELREQLLNADERNVTQPVEIPLLGAFVERFVATYVATNNMPSEAESKKGIFRLHLVPAFGRLRLEQIGPSELEVYKAQKLQAKLAAKTINNHLTVLRKLLATAVEWGLLDTVPVMRWLKLPPEDFRFLTFEEADKLIEAADVEWRAMIIVALRTGLRLGELLALRWADVDLVAGRLVVRRAVARGVVGSPKNGRTREVPNHPTPCPVAVIAWNTCGT